jgi:DNA modification methylase
MKYYCETREFFAHRLPEWVLEDFPLIWLKSDNKGILPDPKRGPRRIYETCFIASRGDRLIVRAVANAYAAPTGAKSHQSEKPEPVLRHFMQMFVDEHTRMLDPTVGSGSALRAAESLHASYVFGLERDPTFAENARVALRNFRTLRAISK